MENRIKSVEEKYIEVLEQKICDLEMINKFPMVMTVFGKTEFEWKEYITSFEKVLKDAEREAQFIVNRENLAFAECRDAEEIMDAAKRIIAAIRKVWSGK